MQKRGNKWIIIRRQINESIWSRISNTQKNLKDDIAEHKNRANEHENLKRQNLDYEEEIIKLKVELAESQSNVCMQENEINVLKSELFNKTHHNHSNEKNNHSIASKENDNDNNDISIRPLELARPKSQRTVKNESRPTKGSSFSNLFGLVKLSSSLLQFEENKKKNHSTTKHNDYVGVIRPLALVRPKSQRIKTERESNIFSNLK